MSWLGEILAWSAEHKKTLYALEISENAPGTVLHDFEGLLSFVQERELPVSKGNQLPTIKALPEINARLAHPVELDLKRPVLKSYPPIQGLYLMLRATGLGTIYGTASKPMLRIEDRTYASWRGLNPAERYFTLLEAWLVRGRPEMVGERGGGSAGPSSHFQDCALLLRSAQGDGLAVAGDHDESYFYYSPGFYAVALLEMFGFLSITRGQPRADEGWQLARLTTTLLGLAVFALLGKELFGDWRRVRELDDLPVSLGVLQSLFQPFVPAWHSTSGRTGHRHPPCHSLQPRSPVPIFVPQSIRRRELRQPPVDG